MLILRMLVAALLLGAASAPYGAQASTFTSDMWVYELTIVPATPFEYYVASTTAPGDTPVPQGCRSRPSIAVDADGANPYETSDNWITCEIATVETLGIDPQTSPYFDFARGTIQIGFNASESRCWSSGFSELRNPGQCPLGLTDTSYYGPGAWFYDVSADYDTGEASYGFRSRNCCEDVVGARVSLGPDGASLSGSIYAAINGTWDLGYGGSFYSQDQSGAYFGISGSGTLISAPATTLASVPLPAPLLLLLSGLLALSAPRVIRNRAA